MPKFPSRVFLNQSSKAIKNLTNQSLPNLRKTLGLESLQDSAVTNMNNALNSPEGSYYTEHLKRIEASLSTFNEDDVIDWTTLDALGNYGSKNLISSAGRSLGDLQNIRNFKARFNKYGSNIKKVEKSGRAFREFLNNELFSVETEVDQTYRNIENFITVTMKEKFGVSGKSFLRDIVTNSKNLQLKYGSDQNQIMHLLLGRSITGKGEAVEFSKSLKNMYVKTLQEYNNKGILLNPKKVSTLQPFKIPKDVLTYMEEERLIQLFDTYTELSDEAIKDIISSYKNPKKHNKNILLNISRRDYKFKDGAKAFKFFKEVNGWSDDSNFIGLYLNAVKADIRSKSLYLNFGSTPLDTITNIVEMFKKNNRLDKKFHIDKDIDTFKHKFEQYYRPHFTSSKTTMLAGNIFSDITSLITGAPATGVHRNAFIDFEANAALIGNGVYNSDYALGHAVTGVFKNYSYLIRHGASAAVGSGEEWRKGVDKILNVMGYANSLDSFSHAMLGLTEDVLDKRYDKFLSKNGMLEKVDENLKRLIQSLYTISGNNSLIDSRRARSAVSFQQLWTSHFKNFNNYSDWEKVFRDKNLHLTDRIDNFYGIGESEWEFLKKANKIELNKKYQTSAKKALLFDEIPDFITYDSILETSDDVAEVFKNTSETAAQFKERVARLWQKLIFHSIQAHVPVPNYTDSITRRINVENPLLHILLRGMLKYWDSANTQWVRVVQRIAENLYGDTSQIVGFDRSLLRYTTGFLKYLSFAVPLVWTRDLGGNRTPTDFRNPQKMLQLMNQSGYFGVTNTMAANLFDLYENSGSGMLSSSPAGGVQETIGSILKGLNSDNEKRLYSSIRGLAKTTGIPQLWGIKGVVDYTLRNALLTPSENRDYNEQLKELAKKQVLVK